MIDWCDFIRRASAVLAVLAVLVLLPDPAFAAHYNYERYEDPIRGFSLQKPAGWSVAIDDGMILLAEPASGEQVILIAPLAVGQGTPPMSIAAAVAKYYFDNFPDYRIDGSWQHSNGRTVRANFHYTDRGGAGRIGTFIVTIDGRMDCLVGFDSSTRYAEAHREAFLAAVQSFSLNRYQFFRTSSPKSAPQTRTPTIAGEFAVRSSADNTAYVYCPTHWKIGGGNIAFYAGEPDESMGVISYTQPYYSQAPPTNAAAWLPEFAGKLLRASDLRILRSAPNVEQMEQCRAAGLNADVTSFIVRFLYGYQNNQVFDGYFDVTIAQATPASGFILTTGALARTDLFERNIEILVSIARSIGTNMQVVMRQQQEQFARLRQASRTMSQTSDIVIATINQMNRDQDRIHAKMNDYYGGYQTKISTADNDVRRFDPYLPNSVADPQYPGYEYRPLTNDEWDRYLRGDLGPAR
jgi:hypothetical protein